MGWGNTPWLAATMSERALEKSPAKYRRVVIDEDLDNDIKEICRGIEIRYEWIEFLEIGTDKDHVHFLIQSAPEHSPSEII